MKGRIFVGDVSIGKSVLWIDIITLNKITCLK